MYAEIGRNTLNPEQLPNRDVVKRMQALLATQPGYRGYLAVETGGSRRIFVRLWDSAAAADAARNSAAVQSFFAQHIAPALKEREIIGQGVLFTTTSAGAENFTAERAAR